MAVRVESYVNLSEYVDVDVEIDEHFYSELDTKDKQFLAEQLSKDPEVSNPPNVPTCLFDVVARHLGAGHPTEQAWLKEKITQIEWDFKNRNFEPPAALKAIDF